MQMIAFLKCTNVCYQIQFLMFFEKNEDHFCQNAFFKIVSEGKKVSEILYKWLTYFNVHM